MYTSDDDIKIYETPEDGLEQDVYGGEEAAEEFLFHKERGNFLKSRELGEVLARTMLQAAPGLAADPWRNQKLTLLSFLAIDCLGDTMDNHMLQRSADTAFRKALEARSPEVFRTVTDSTAYTYFMLNDRLGQERTDGQVLAELCDEDNIALVVEGDKLAIRYRNIFTELIRSVQFAQYAERQ